VFDLDETLIHSVVCKKDHPDALEIAIEGTKTYVKILPIKKNKLRVNIRPFMYEFLHEMKKLYDLCIYTASQAPYANAI
jgi:TFIIF-interacting CTD phosphatase-like protein